MIKIKVTNERIVNFYLNAQNLIKQLTGTGKRSRYSAVLQAVSENVEDTYKAIVKKQSRLEQKYAKTKESGEFLYTEGSDKSYVYTKKDKEELDDEVEKLFAEEKTIEVDEIYYLKEKDLPNNDGVVIVSNQLLKVFSGFIISKELCDKLIYFGIKDTEKPVEESIEN